MDTKRYRSISRDLTFAIIIIVFITSALLIFLNYRLSLNKAVMSLESKADELISQLISGIAIHIYNFSEREAEDILNYYMGYEEIAYIRLGYDNKQVTKGRKPADSDHYIIRVRPIIKNNIEVGEIEIALSKGMIYRSQKLLLYGLLVFTVVVIAIIIISIKIILRLLLENPLNALNSSINDIAEGNYYKKLQKGPHYDLNIIIDDVNTLAENIGERERNLIGFREYMEIALEAIPSIIINVDRDFTITHANSKAMESLWSNSKSMNITGTNLFASTSFFNRYRDIIEKANYELSIEELQKVPYLDNEYNQYYYNIMVYPHGSDRPGGVVIRIDDVTKSVENEKRLKNVQSVEIVGSLGAGLAHDFNNTLMGITGSASLLTYRFSRSDYIEKEFIAENLNIIEKSAGRAKNIVSQLLTLTKEQGFDFCPVDLNGTIKHIYKFCSASFDKRIKIIPDYNIENAVIYGDPNQVEQVIHNLSINAMHAMTIMRKDSEEQGGLLHYSLEKIYADEKFCADHPGAIRQNYWKLSVKDSGVGMSKMTIARIFEPFYTTKKRGEGTGLGMSMVDNIVKMHGGLIDIDSEIGSGTSVSVYFPEYTGSDDFLYMEDEDYLYHGKGTVLFCDDEEIIRDMAMEMISSLGYHVILADSGIQAIDLFRKDPDKIDIIITENNMHDISGSRIISKLRNINSKVRIIISSGFCNDAEEKEMISAGISGFLRKPYTIYKISAMLEKALKKGN